MIYFRLLIKVGLKKLLCSVTRANKSQNEMPTLALEVPKASPHQLS